MTNVAQSRPLLPPVVLGMLALISATAPLNINTYISGLPQLAQDLNVNQAGAQLTLTFFMIGLAVGQLIMGPVADALGRRNLFIIGTIGLVVTSAASALAPVAWVLYLARFIMGLAGGAAMVLVHSAAADLVRGPELARVFSLLMMVGGIAPVIGPVVGGFIVAAAGWRAVFWPS